MGNLCSVEFSLILLSSLIWFSRPPDHRQQLCRNWLRWEGEGPDTGLAPVPLLAQWSWGVRVQNISHSKTQIETIYIYFYSLHVSSYAHKIFILYVICIVYYSQFTHHTQLLIMLNIYIYNKSDWKCNNILVLKSLKCWYLNSCQFRTNLNVTITINILTST